MNSGMTEGAVNRSFVFLTMNDFRKDGGGSVRMYGLLNALAGKGCDVVLMSNAACTERFHPAIRHIAIGRPVSRRQKRVLQGIMSWLPLPVTAFVYSKLLRRLGECLAGCPRGTETLYSFEYLDNSIACLMKSRGYVSHYVNDTHGMAPIEFGARLKVASTPLQRIRFRLKRLSATLLDRKVFSHASGVIYASRIMQRYYEQHVIIPGHKPDAMVIPFVFGGDPDRRPDPALEKRLREQYGISGDDFLFMFAGSYKVTSGVDNLIDAFCEIHAGAPHTKLMLIGRSGPLWETCMEKVRSSGFGDSIILIDSVPYSELGAYQSLASVIVCPDRANRFSEYVVHTKYFDSLCSGKPVINGGFEIVRQINPDEKLSLLFDPEDPADLCRAMEYSLANYAALSEKYGSNREYVRDHLTYRSFVELLMEWNNRR